MHVHMYAVSGSEQEDEGAPPKLPPKIHPKPRRPSAPPLPLKSKRKLSKPMVPPKPDNLRQLTHKLTMEENQKFTKETNGPALQPRLPEKSI